MRCAINSRVGRAVPGNGTIAAGSALRAHSLLVLRSTIRGVAMLASRTSNQTASPGNGSSGLSELKRELDKLSREVTRIAASRAERASALAESGVSTTRETIAEYPIPAMVGAFAVGALLGLALVPSSSSSNTRHLSRSWTDREIREELQNYAEDLRRNVQRSVRGSTIADGLERLASALSATDARSSIQPALDRVMGWLGQARNTAADAVNRVTG